MSIKGFKNDFVYENDLDYERLKKKHRNFFIESMFPVETEELSSSEMASGLEKLPLPASGDSVTVVESFISEVTVKS